MNVEYRNGPPLTLNNLTDEELDEATKKHILERIPDVVHAEIWRGKPLPEPANRHERRRAAKLERQR